MPVAFSNTAYTSVYRARFLWGRAFHATLNWGERSVLNGGSPAGEAGLAAGAPTGSCSSRAGSPLPAS